MKRLAFIGCGGRDYGDDGFVTKTLDTLALQYDVRLVITGGAKGADFLVDNWAKSRRKSRMVIEADWEAHGKMAGPVRNADMLGFLGLVKANRPDWAYGVVAFPGGAGTTNMTKQAEEAGYPVKRFP